MSPAIVAVGGIGLLAGAGAGVLMAGRLATLQHRYDDEADVRVISFRWTILVTALVAGLVGAAQTHVGGALQGILYCALTIPLVVLAAIDFDVHRLPDRWTGPILLATLVALVLLATVHHDWHALLVAILCAAVVAVFFLLIAVIAGGQGFGLGDVKLSPTLGLLLGFNGAVEAGLGIFAGFLSGAVLGLILIVFTGAGRKTAISFGPHMIIGALVVLALPLVGALD